MGWGGHGGGGGGGFHGGGFHGGGMAFMGGQGGQMNTQLGGFGGGRNRSAIEDQMQQQQHQREEYMGMMYAHQGQGHDRKEFNNSTVNMGGQMGGERFERQHFEHERFEARREHWLKEHERPPSGFLEALGGVAAGFGAAAGRMFGVSPANAAEYQPQAQGYPQQWQGGSQQSTGGQPGEQGQPGQPGAGGQDKQPIYKDTERFGDTPAAAGGAAAAAAPHGMSGEPAKVDAQFAGKVGVSSLTPDQIAEAQVMLETIRRETQGQKMHSIDARKKGVDGVFGTDTRQAVADFNAMTHNSKAGADLDVAELSRITKRFQALEGKDRTGNLDAATLAAIQKEQQALQKSGVSVSHPVPGKEASAEGAGVGGHDTSLSEAQREAAKAAANANGRLVNKSSSEVPSGEKPVSGVFRGLPGNNSQVIGI